MPHGFMYRVGGCEFFHQYVELFRIGGFDGAENLTVIGLYGHRGLRELFARGMNCHGQFRRPQVPSLKHDMVVGC